MFWSAGAACPLVRRCAIVVVNRNQRKHPCWRVASAAASPFEGCCCLSIHIVSHLFETVADRWLLSDRCSAVSIIEVFWPHYIAVDTVASKLYYRIVEYQQYFSTPVRNL